MKVPFAKLMMNFPDPDSVPMPELWRSLGYSENGLNPNFMNTCATRLSVALIASGYPNPGSYLVKAGKYKGRMIETKQRKLSNWLVRWVGPPEKYQGGVEAQSAIGNRSGIISFFHLHGPTDSQGHVSPIAKDSWGTYRCGHRDEREATGCFWDSVEVWFWSLP